MKKADKKCEFKSLIKSSKNDLINHVVFSLLFLSICCFFDCRLAVAQDPPASSSSESAKFPKFKETASSHDQRMAILKDERESTKKNLEAAIAAEAKAKDPIEASASVKRLQGDLQAIEREISLVEAQYANSPSTTKKPSPNAAGDSMQDSKRIAEKSESNFEAWDVFRNFGKKGN